MESDKDGHRVQEGISQQGCRCCTYAAVTGCEKCGSHTVPLDTELQGTKGTPAAVPYAVVTLVELP